MFKDVKVRSIRFVRGGEISETMYYECALPFSCGAAREDAGVPNTVESVIPLHLRHSPSSILPLRKGEIYGRFNRAGTQDELSLVRLRRYSYASNRHPRVLTRGSGF